MSTMTTNTSGPVPRRIKTNYAVVALGAYVAAFLLFLLLPIVAVVVVSFSSASFIVFPLPGFSLRWYARIIEYRPFVDSLIVSIEVAIGSAILGASLGVPAALWAARSRTYAASVVANLLLAPISVPAIVLGFSLLYLLSALALGISFISLLITHTVVAIPYIARTALAVYRSMPPDFEEAATMLGASRWQTLRHVRHDSADWE